jgi:hypothetical protein
MSNKTVKTLTELTKGKDGSGNDNWTVYHYQEVDSDNKVIMSKVLCEPVIDVKQAHLSPSGNPVFHSTGKQGFRYSKTLQGDRVKVIATVMISKPKGDYGLAKTESTGSGGESNNDSLVQVGNC